MSERLEKIRQLETDFSQKNGPFADVQFPEERLLETMRSSLGASGETWSLSFEGRLRLISAFAMLDYNRDANQLVDNLIELHDVQAGWFKPMGAPDSEEELEYQFEEIGFRYPSRDAHAWAVNNRIVRTEYSGMWSELLMDTGMDAISLVDRLKSDGFLCLKGVKIAPMYARIIDDEVAPLSNLWSLDIPVDTHIRRLSQDLFERFDGDTTTDDEIREIWRLYGSRHNVDRHVVDGALWHIGNKWSDWGEDYWEQL